MSVKKNFRLRAFASIKENPRAPKFKTISVNAPIKENLRAPKFKAIGLESAPIMGNGTTFEGIRFHTLFRENRQ